MYVYLNKEKTEYNIPEVSFSSVEVGSGNALESSCDITCTNTHICSRSYTERTFSWDSTHQYRQHNICSGLSVHINTLKVILFLCTEIVTLLIFTTLRVPLTVHRK